MEIESGDIYTEELRNCNVDPDTGVITVLPTKTYLRPIGVDTVKHCLSQKDLYKVQNCFVKIERMTLHKEQYICKTCGKTFSRRSSCTYHMRRHVKKETTTEKKIATVTTNTTKQTRIRVSKNNTGLKNREKVKRHVCEFCGKLFRIKSQLKNHERTHTGERPYTCGVCNRAFSERSNLRKHERAHTGERPFSCQVCKRQFAVKSNLLNHILIHTKEKPHSCDVCFKRFRCFSTFTRHKLLHSKDKQFTCNDCGHQFTRKHRLIEHILAHNTKSAIDVNSGIKKEI